MTTHQVVATNKETEWSGGQHRHIAALCLDDRRRVLKANAIANLKSGAERYYTYADGLQAWVEVVERCGLCREEYMRTDRDTTTRNNLLSLPDC